MKLKNIYNVDISTMKLNLLSLIQLDKNYQLSRAHTSGLPQSLTANGYWTASRPHSKFMHVFGQIM